jgi:hypothetical protein
MASSRPMLNPALTPIWRDENTLQIGVDPRRAAVLAGITPARAAFLRRLDGSLTRAQALEAGAAHGLLPAEVAHLLEVLADAGVLVDGGVDLSPLTAMSTAERDRLAPDLAAWSCTGSDGRAEGHGPDLAASTLARRRRAVVGVRGAGRVGATLVGLLAAAGVGRLAVSDPKPMRGYDVAPGGAGPSGLRQPRADAAMAAALATAPATRAGAGPDGRADLEVLCPDGPSVEPAERDRLLASGVPHMLATTYERVGVVGPLVVPGRTPCLRCLDLHRVDRDRAWPMVSAQLAAPGRTLGATATVAACDVVLATAVAAHAALAALAYLDDPAAQSPLCGAGLELRPPLGRPRRRAWGSHPSCGCRWSGTPLDEAG